MDNNSEVRVWGIHGLDDNLFLRDKVIAIGWHKIGDLSKIENSRDAFKEKYKEAYPNATPGSVSLVTGMLYRFCHEVQIGDYVVFPSKSDRKVNIGQVTSEYFYNTDKTEEFVQQRKVKWLKHLPRTDFSQGALYEIGSAMTFFL